MHANIRALLQTHMHARLRIYQLFFNFFRRAVLKINENNFARWYIYTLFAMNKVVCSPNVLMLSFFWQSCEVHNHLTCNYEKCLPQNKNCISIKISIFFLMATLANRLLLLIMIKTSPPSPHSSTWREENALSPLSLITGFVFLHGERDCTGCVFSYPHIPPVHIYIYIRSYMLAHTSMREDKYSQAADCLFFRRLCQLLLCAHLINISCPIFNIIRFPNRISFEMLLKVNSLLTMVWCKSLFSSLKKKRLHMVCCHSSMNSSFLMENQRYFTLIQREVVRREEGKAGHIHTLCFKTWENNASSFLWFCDYYPACFWALMGSDKFM